jgi:hypothetical protein
MEEMEGIQSMIENKLFTKGIIVSKMPTTRWSCFGQPFRVMPQNSGSTIFYDDKRSGLVFFLKKVIP